MSKNIEKKPRFIRLEGILSQTGERRIKDKSIGPFPNYDSAREWVDKNGFSPVDQNTITKFVRIGPGFLNTVLKCSGMVDFAWAEIRSFDEDPEHSNISSKQEHVRV